jgi:predicted transposase/invertase (TIGR01784 family)
MIINIRPTVDLAFRLMLGSPEHPAITLHFLNSVIVSESPIRQVTILNPTLEKEVDDDKLAILDIKAQDETGRVFNIEMQTSLAGSLQRRLMYYAARLYSQQLKDGMPYRQLCPTISICVLSKTLFPQFPHLHFDFRMRERFALTLIEDFQIHLIELPKSTTTVHNVRSSNSLQRWAFFLARAHEIDADELRRLLPEPEFHEALGVLEMITHTPATRELYEARLKAKLDEEARLYDARTEGLSQGISQGISQGRLEGLSQGKWIGRIQTLEGLLGLTLTDPRVLESWSETELATKAQELEQHFRTRP